MRACLRAIFVHRREDLELFEQAFRLFFRPHQELHNALSLLLPQSRLAEENVPANISRRVAEALPPPPARLQPRRRPEPEADLEVDASLTASDIDVLRQRDFAAMSAEEPAQARRLLLRLRFAVQAQPTRRMQPARIRDAAQRRSASRPARQPAHRWRRSAAVLSPPAPAHPAFDRALRYQRLDGSLHRDADALCPHADDGARAGGDLPLRHALDRRDALAARTGHRSFTAALRQAGRGLGAARASGPACASSTIAGRVACSGRGRSSSSSPMGWSASPIPEPSTDLAAEAARLRRPASAWWAEPALSYAGFTPARAAFVRCCRTSMSFVPCTT